MKTPAFQFYPESWTANTKLGRCSWEARGVWIRVLCVMHDSDEYGVIRYPLAELAGLIGCTMKPLRELVDKGVLKGGDKGTIPAYIHTPRHAGKDGTPIVLLPECDGPMWYSIRFVRDEYRRQNAGKSTRFGPGGTPPDRSPTRRDGERQGESPPRTPTRRNGSGALVLDSVSINGVVDGNADARGRQSKNRSGEISPGKAKPPKGWHKTAEGCNAMGLWLGLRANAGETLPAYKDRLFKALTAREASH